MPTPTPLPVLIAGGGPVGLSLAALLAAHGIRSLVIEADDGYCTGSRAICISRRSLEILAWAGAERALLDKGLPWVGGRSHFRNEEVLHFRMPSEPTQRFAPMFNIQQYYIEQFAHDAAREHGALTDVRWSTRVVALRGQADHVEIDVEAGGEQQTLRAAWVVACDGGRSTVRDLLGLPLRGTQYDGRYVIVDIEQETQREVERLAWFDPPSNPGSTILMHRQPDGVWRIDYQVRDDEDPVEAVKPENVLPRVQRHLEMIGETAPWKPLWISIYNAKCLTMDSYRHGRVLFAGDAAHLVPIFGVRGLNSGLDDAGNLAWKLALVVQGNADESLLDSYSTERVLAARENIAYGAKSTEFMAPPNFAFSLMREATLRLALRDESVRSLINPRQTAPIAYGGSPLNAADDDAALFDDGVRPGEPAPEALLMSRDGPVHLSEHFGRGFVCLYFTATRDAPPGLRTLADALRRAPLDSDALLIHPSGQAPSADGAADVHGQAWQRCAADEGTLLVVRPDGYVLGRWRAPDWTALAASLPRLVALTDERVAAATGGQP
jgi:3-(3-hydroxy-phenyl)propionate hydroxylase